MGAFTGFTYVNGKSLSCFFNKLLATGLMRQRRHGLLYFPDGDSIDV